MGWDAAGFFFFLSFCCCTRHGFLDKYHLANSAFTQDLPSPCAPLLSPPPRRSHWDFQPLCEWFPPCFRGAGDAGGGGAQQVFCRAPSIVKFHGTVAVQCRGQVLCCGWSPTAFPSPTCSESLTVCSLYVKHCQSPLLPQLLFTSAELFLMHMERRKNKGSVL